MFSSKTNPILDDLRLYRRTNAFAADPRGLYLSWHRTFSTDIPDDALLPMLYGRNPGLDGETITSDHLNHARKVLRRLVVAGR